LCRFDLDELALLFFVIADAESQEDGESDPETEEDAAVEIGGNARSEVGAAAEAESESVNFRLFCADEGCDSGSISTSSKPLNFRISDRSICLLSPCADAADAADAEDECTPNMHADNRCNNRSPVIESRALPSFGQRVNTKKSPS
jgi:hypothetical protein